MYTNVDSLSNKFYDLKLFLNSLSNTPKVIAITEVNPKSVIYKRKESEFSLEGYNLFSVNVGNTTHRGIIVYISKEISATEIYVSAKFSECLLLQLRVDVNELFLIGTFYRSPNSSLENDKCLLDTLNELSNKFKCKSLYIGDFNMSGIHWPTCTSVTSKQCEISFLSCLQNNFLTQHVTQPTRARGSDNPHILDLFITNDDFLDNILYFSPIGKSDHSVIICNCIIKATNVVNTEKFNYNKGDYDAFRIFMNRDWYDVFSSCGDNVNLIWNVFKVIFNEGFNNFVPKLKNNYWKRKPTWHRPISKTLKKLINRKHRLWRRFQETKSPVIEALFKTVRNKVRNESRKLQKQEELKIASSSKNNSKKFWQYIKSKTKFQSSVGNINLVAPDTDSVLADNADKCEAFADFFTKLYTDEPSGEFDPLPNILPSISCDCIEITEENVFNKLASLKIDKSPGPDNFHPRVFNELKSELCLAFKIIFDVSLKFGQLPNDWKRSVVSVLHKKGDKKLISNYRPISLTCIACKILESIIRDKLMEYFICNNLFSNYQFGFIKGRSTTLQLLNVIDKWTSSLENGGQVDIVYMDFEKAFDKVPHNRLLSKLESYGINNDIIKWIKAFLCGRSFSVRINGTYSEWLPVISGIPQGSVLGPLLFVIFINDLAVNFNLDSNIFLFADDGKVFKHIKDNVDSVELQKHCQDFYNWSEKWLMKLNIDKCKIVSISKNDNANHYTYGFETNNGDFIVLEHVKNIQDLGITIDAKLSFEAHIYDKIGRAYQMLGIINKNFNKINQQTTYCFILDTTTPFNHVTLPRPRLRLRQNV